MTTFGTALRFPEDSASRPHTAPSNHHDNQTGHQRNMLSSSLNGAAQHHSFLSPDTNNKDKNKFVDEDDKNPRNSRLTSSASHFKSNSSSKNYSFHRHDHHGDQTLQSSSASHSKKHHQSDSSNGATIARFSGNPTITLRASSQHGPTRPHTREGLRNGTESFTDGAIEAEFIKNLQQQVYYLELEVKFLRGEIEHADVQGKEELIKELKAELQEVKRFFQEERATLIRKLDETHDSYSELEHSHQELNRALQNTQDSSMKLKNDSLQANISLKKAIESLQSDLVSRDRLLLAARSEKDSLEQKVQEAERETRLLQAQIHDLENEALRNKNEISSQKNAEQNLLLSISALEQQITETNASTLNSSLGAWKEENMSLRTQLKETEIELSKERQVKESLSKDCQLLVKENARLNSELSDLKRSQSRSKNLIDDKTGKYQTLYQETLELKARVQQLEENVADKETALHALKSHAQRVLQDMTERDKTILECSSKLKELHQYSTDLRARTEREEKENIDLRKEKSLLLERLNSLQSLERNESEELTSLRAQYSNLHGHYLELDKKFNFLSKVHAIRWSDLEHMASAVQAFTHEMHDIEPTPEGSSA